MASTMRDWCEHLAWRYIAGAVLDVYKENQEPNNPLGISGDSDAWVMYTYYRNNLMRRVTERWCLLTKRDPSWFPYTEDGVVRIYMRYRKRSAEELKGYERELQELAE